MDASLTGSRTDSRRKFSMPRKIWVSTIALRGRYGATVLGNIEQAGSLIERAALDRPDIVCLPENFAYKGLSDTPAERSEPIPGPVTEMAMERAKKHGIHIICPLMEKRGKVLYNTVAVINRQGKVAGTYEKLHPVTSSPDFTEFEGGVTPGREPIVFDLDFGRIGVLTCFDILWPREFARLAEMGAEIVFWPADAGGGFPLRARAWDHHYYVVSSSTGNHSCIIDITGEILEQTGPWTPVAVAEIDLEKKFFSTGFNASWIPAIKKKYGRDVAIRLYSAESGMTIQSNRQGLSVADLMAEFGLETVAEFIARHERAEILTREGKGPEPQNPLGTRRT